LSVDAARPLAGKTALVTGGARGIGAAVAERFAREGAEGVVLDLEPALAEGRPPEGWTGVPADLRDDGDTARAFALVAEPSARLDVLVAAAGIVPPWRGVEQLDLDEWDRVFAVNARGVAATLRHAAPLLAPGGSVVVIASLNAWRGDRNLMAYVASKHAALGIVRSAALDLGRRGIRVNGVAPGPIATDALLERMRAREREGGIAVRDALAQAADATALGRIATADEVASAALFLASDHASAITGHLLPVDGGIA
jgi:NAD(P)-dependent dehydrogenase (short-subunit alcohol dehydrogenase family)